ncbi:hypothetical protein BDZ91DRAFT_357144 [Kalaharituber pfeilii]|nr:hypothetical protein BDZ91DRAFT_357144 [Kalaharituber pfeilii]
MQPLPPMYHLIPSMLGPTPDMGRCMQAAIQWDEMEKLRSQLSSDPDCISSRGVLMGFLYANGPISEAGSPAQQFNNVMPPANCIDSRYLATLSPDHLTGDMGIRQIPTPPPSPNVDFFFAYNSQMQGDIPESPPDMTSDSSLATMSPISTMMEFEEPTMMEFEEPTMMEFGEPTMMEFEEPTMMEFEEPTMMEFEEPTPAETDESSSTSVGCSPTQLELPYAYPCQGCTRSFLKRHERNKHFKEAHLKPFLCSYPGCAKVWPSRKDLRRHVNAVHLKLALYECTECGKQGSRRDNFRVHMEKVHGIEKPQLGQLLKQLPA